MDAIAVDAGSVDPGPNYLGQGKFFVDEGIVQRDLEILLSAVDREGVPLLIGSAGGGGSSVQLERLADIIAQVADRNGYSFIVGKIFTDMERDYVMEHVRAGMIEGLGRGTDLSSADVDRAERIVAQVGVEPFIEALNEGVDVVVVRSSDLSPFAALPIYRGFDPGITYHLATILECGSRATTRGSGDDCLVGHVDENYFEVVPPNPDIRCTEQSVAAHTLYEKADPYTIDCPAGSVDVSNAQFEQRSDRVVRVTRSTFEPDPAATTLIEGVELAGYRTITPAGIRDEYLIDRIDRLTSSVRERVSDIPDIDDDEYTLQFRKYGYDAVPLSETEAPESIPEIGIIVDVVGETQEIADTICGLSRTSLLHYPIDGRMNTGGNLAFPYSPSDISVGEVYKFSIYYLLENVDPDRLYNVEVEVV